MKILITGSAGFFGGILTNAALARGHSCVGFDLLANPHPHPAFTAIQGDIRNRDTLETVFSQHNFDAVFHCAAILAHAVRDKDLLWTSNVDGSRNVRDAAIKHNVSKIVFASSNCLWGRDLGRPIREHDEPCPVEIYGRSKQEAEKILLERTDMIDAIVIRCPTIIDSGRLGLLAILFAFIDEGRKVWVVGAGDNRYQFIYAPDLADAFLKALHHRGSAIFNIGSDHVPTIRDMYESVIRKAGTGARLASIPRDFAIPILKLAYALGLSPLGPYQYKMIAQNFEFDTTRIKNELGWRPTTTNEEMLWEAYEYYHTHRNSLRKSTGVSAHRQPAPMGVLRVLKCIS